MDAVVLYLPYLAVGLGVTILVSLASYTLAVALGFALAIGRVHGGRGTVGAIAIYLMVFRSLPELLVIFFFYYGLDMAMKAAGTGIDPFIAVTLAIGVQFAAYACEIFRDAHAAIPRGLIEAGRAIGQSPRQILARIETPLMLRAALPSLGNLGLVVVKITALASVVGLEEIVRRAKIVAGSTREPIATYLAASLCFLVLTAVIMLALARIERAQKGGVRA